MTVAESDSIPAMGARQMRWTVAVLAIAGLGSGAQAQAPPAPSYTLFGAGVIKPLNVPEYLAGSTPPLPLGVYAHYTGIRPRAEGASLRVSTRAQYVGGGGGSVVGVTLGAGLSLPIAPDPRRLPYWFLAPTVHLSGFDDCARRTDPFDYSCSGIRAGAGLAVGGGLFLTDPRDEWPVVVEAELTHLGRMMTALSVGISVAKRTPVRQATRCCRTGFP